MTRNSTNSKDLVQGLADPVTAGWWMSPAAVKLNKKDTPPNIAKTIVKKASKKQAGKATVKGKVTTLSEFTEGMNRTKTMEYLIGSFATLTDGALFEITTATNDDPTKIYKHGWHLDLKFLAMEDGGRPIGWTVDEKKRKYSGYKVSGPLVSYSTGTPAWYKA